MSAAAGGPISRDDIEAKFRDIQGGVDEVADNAVNYVLLAGAVIAVGIVVVAFALGRRRGKHKSAIIEVRRL